MRLMANDEKMLDSYFSAFFDDDEGDDEYFPVEEWKQVGLPQSLILGLNPREKRTTFLRMRILLNPACMRVLIALARARMACASRRASSPMVERRLRRLRARQYSVSVSSSSAVL